MELLKKSIFFISIVGLISCSASAKLRRAERLIAKAELQGAHWRSDTVWKTTEYFIPQVRVDTAFKTIQGDTVFIHKDRLRMKYFMNHDTVYLDGECLPDTVEIKVPVHVTKTIEAKRGAPWWFWLLVAVCFIGGAWTGAKLAKR